MFSVRAGTCPVTRSLRFTASKDDIGGLTCGTAPKVATVRRQARVVARSSPRVPAARPTLGLLGPRIYLLPSHVPTPGITRPPKPQLDRGPSPWRQSFAVRDQSVIDEIRAAPVARIVTVTISSATAREDGQREWLVIERETLCSPVNRSDWLTLLPESAGREWTASDSAAKEWRKAISDWAAKKLLDPVTEGWGLPGSIADGLGRLQEHYHDLMLGEPVQFASAALGLPSPAGAILSGIVSEHRLPADPGFTGLKRLVQLTGTVGGFATGHFHMAYASMVSYGRDRATEVVSKQIETFFAPEPPKTALPAKVHNDTPIVVIVRPPKTPLAEGSPPRTLKPEPNVSPRGIGEVSINWRQGGESTRVPRKTK